MQLARDIYSAMQDQIQVRRTFYPVKQFVSWHGQKQLVLKPPFQRNFVWKPRAKSYLIDSILRGYPLPIIILRDRAGLHIDPIVEVVDGQQRLTSLISFIAPERFRTDLNFTISKVHSDELAGKSFAQLDTQLQQRLLDYELSVHILPSSVDDQQVLRIFARLNSTGESLKEQELRNAEFTGEFKTRMFELSLQQLDFWRKFNLFSEDSFARMKEVEFTSDLAIRVLYGMKATTQATLNKEYRLFDDTFPDATEVSRRFNGIMQLIDTNVGDQISRSEYKKIQWFFTLFGVVHDHTYGTNRNTNPPLLMPGVQRPLPDGFWQAVLKLSDDLRNPNIISAETLKTLTSRTTHLETRRNRDRLLSRYIGRP
jgi:hypothetical protein